MQHEQTIPIKQRWMLHVPLEQNNISLDNELDGDVLKRFYLEILLVNQKLKTGMTKCHDKIVLSFFR